MKVCCVFSLESPHQGDSNEYTQYTIFNMNKKKHTKLSQTCSYGLFSKGLKNEFETAMVNEPSVFEQLKFYCTVYLTMAMKHVCNCVRVLAFDSDISISFQAQNVALMQACSEGKLVNCYHFFVAKLMSHEFFTDREKRFTYLFTNRMKKAFIMRPQVICLIIMTGSSLMHSQCTFFLAV